MRLRHDLGKTCGDGENCFSGYRDHCAVDTMADSMSSLSDSWRVRPLVRVRKDGTPYSREPEVEAQVRRLSSMGKRARREQLVPQSERRRREAAREETLVYFLREYARRGDTETAWEIADWLVQRVAGHVRRELARWRLTPDAADDCARDLFATLLAALFDDSPAGEFWEVRFWVCLDRRLWNLAEKRQQTLDSEWRRSDGSDEDGDEGTDPLSRLPDPRPGPAALTEYKDALNLLTETERLALYLRHIEGWPEETADPNLPSIAGALGVTGRSVRNYLRRAEAKLRAWQQADLK